VAKIEVGSKVFAVFGIDRRGLEIVSAVVRERPDVGIAIEEVEHIVGEKLMTAQGRAYSWASTDRVHLTLGGAVEQAERIAREGIKGVEQTYGQLLDFLEELDRYRPIALPWKEIEGGYRLTDPFYKDSFEVAVAETADFDWMVEIVINGSVVRSSFGLQTAEEGKEAAYEWLTELRQTLDNILGKERLEQ
jgi:hypothetical protein